MLIKLTDITDEEKDEFLQSCETQFINNGLWKDLGFAGYNLYAHYWIVKHLYQWV